MSFPYFASRTSHTSAIHDLDHAAAPLLGHHSHSQQRTYHAADSKDDAPSADNDVEDGRRHHRTHPARSNRPNYAAPILPFPSPSRATTATHSDVDETPYESPFSAFSAYQSDYSSPGDPLDYSTHSPYGYQRHRSLVSTCWASLVGCVGAVVASVHGVVSYPVSHPQETAMAVVCAALVLASSGEQVTRKLLASSLYNYRYGLFLLLSLSSALLSTLLAAAQWRTVRPYLSLSALPPLLPVLLLVLLSAVASLLLLLSTAILPAPLALLFPQLLIPLSLLSARWWARQPVKRDVSLGCGLIALSIGVLTASAIYQAEAHSTTDAFIPNRAEVCWNQLLLAVSILLSATVWQVRASLLCAYDMHPLVLSSMIGWGQFAAGLLVSPAALWLQYLGTDRWRGVDHRGAGGGLIISAGNGTLSSSSTGRDGDSSGALLSSSSSTGLPSSSASSATQLWSSSASTASESSTISTTSSQSESSSYDSSSADASTAVSPSSSSAVAPDSSSALLSLLSSTASASSSLVPHSLSSSLMSILSATSSYLTLTHTAASTTAASHALSPYEHLLLPVIPSPDYLPSPTPAATSTAAHPAFHASTLLNLQHFSRCLLTAHNSEYGDTCGAPLLPLAAAFVASCLAGQWAMAALAKRSAASGGGSGGGMVSGVLVVAAVVAVLCFVCPWVGVSSWLPYHQRVLLDGVAGGGWWDGWSFGVCVVLLCLGCWLCGRQEERVVAGVNVWERVEALMREQETARGSEEGRDRRAAVRRAREHGRR